MELEDKLMADLVVLLRKHRIKAGVLIVPIEEHGEQGTSCLRVNICMHDAGRIMGAVAADLITSPNDAAPN